MLARHILAVLFVVHVGLLLFTYVPEIGVCDVYTLPKTTYIDDEREINDRLTTAAQFQMLSAFEVVLMACVVIAGKMLPASAPLPGFMLLLPGAILVGVIAVRMRHTGMLGCAAGDKECCSNMICLDYHLTTLPGTIGCNDLGDPTQQIPILWLNRKTYCPVPHWYDSNTATLCRGLRGTPNLAACYQYGCSSVATPVPYYGVRVLMLNAILFVYVACRS